MSILELIVMIITMAVVNTKETLVLFRISRQNIEICYNKQTQILNGFEKKFIFQLK